MGMIAYEDESRVLSDKLRMRSVMTRCFSKPDLTATNDTSFIGNPIHVALDVCRLDSAMPMTGIDDVHNVRAKASEARKLGDARPLRVRKKVKESA